MKTPDQTQLPQQRFSTSTNAGANTATNGRKFCAPGNAICHPIVRSNSSSGRRFISLALGLAGLRITSAPIPPQIPQAGNANASLISNSAATTAQAYTANNSSAAAAANTAAQQPQNIAGANPAEATLAQVWHQALQDAGETTGPLATTIAREILADTLLPPQQLRDYDTILPLALPPNLSGQPVSARLAISQRRSSGSEATFVRIDLELERLGPLSLRFSHSGQQLALSIHALNTMHAAISHTSTICIMRCKTACSPPLNYSI